MIYTAMSLEIAVAFLVAIVSLIYLPVLVSPLVLKVLHKGSLSDFVNKHDSQLWLITLINFIYRLESFVRTEKGLCEIDSIIVYPIKSIGKGLLVKQWDIGEFGLMYDRQYVFASFDEKKQKWVPITLRQFDKLIQVEYEARGNSFIVKFGNGKYFELPMKFEKSHLNEVSQGVMEVQLWNVPVESHDVSKLFPIEFIEFFNLPQDTKLFFTERGHPVKTAAPPNLPNTIDGSKYRNATFQDYYPLLIISRNDLLNLNQKLAENGFEYFKVNEFNFRPNIIVKGDISLHDEDSWYHFSIRTLVDKRRHYFTTTTKCGRCQVPNINYSSGPTMDKSAPVSKTLSKYRRVDTGNKFLTYFGVYAVQHETGYTISAGDTFDVAQRRVSIFESTS